MLLDYVIKNGGATINKRGEIVTLKSGYQVSKQDICKCLVSELTEQKIQNVISYGLKRGEYAGIWIENGYAYIDKSVRINTKKDALQKGVELNQISIFDWKKTTCIYC